MGVRGPMLNVWKQMPSLAIHPLTHMEIQRLSISVFSKKLTDVNAASYIPANERKRKMFTLTLRMLDEMNKPRHGNIANVLEFSNECLEKNHFDPVLIMTRSDERELFRMALCERYPLVSNYRLKKMKNQPNYLS